MPLGCQFALDTFRCSPEDPFLRVSNDTFRGVKVMPVGFQLALDTFGCLPEDSFLRVSNDTFRGKKEIIQLQRQ